VNEGIVLEMFWHSVLLFLRGKLFQNPGHVMRQSAIGAGITAISCVALTKLVGSVWLAVLISALIGGALQPWLFKNLKYN
jgi:hypothetical protein